MDIQGTSIIGIRSRTSLSLLYALFDIRTTVAKKNMSSNVGLNVGGKIYRTSRTTLLSRESDSFFALLLSGRVPSEKDEQGNYLIDCDGEIFCHILNYMQNGKLVLPDGFIEYGLLECQADFFQLESLKLELKGIHHGNEKEFLGLNVRKKEGNKIYHIERESLVRYPESYFAKLLRENTYAPVDKHGNYIVNILYNKYECSNEGIFRDILHYLRSGDICKLLSATPWRLNEIIKESQGTWAESSQ